MNISTKLLKAAAGQAGGATTDVTDVFSTFLYDGTGSKQFIENGIRLGANRGSGASVQFDGVDDRLSFSGQLANASDSKTFTLSAFVYPQHTSDMMFLQYGTTRFIFKVDGSGKLVVQAFNSSSTKILTLESRLTSGGGLVTGGWQHVLVSVDLASTSNRHLYIDDAIPAHVDWDSYTNDSIDFTTSGVGVAGSPTAVQGKQRLSNVYLDFTYRDLSTTSNRRLFIGTDLAPATGQASLNPIIYLPLDGTTANTGVNSGTGGNFTVTGSPTVLTDGGPFAHPDGGEGGLVWIKQRNATRDHALFDTERGTGKYIRSNQTTEESTQNLAVSAFNSNGFSLGGSNGITNNSSQDYVSWTFRKAPKFFDVVTYTGTGPGSAANEQQVSHNLGVKPGLVFIKSRSTTGNWWVFTDVIDGTNDYSYLNSTNAFGNSSNNVPTDSIFNVGGVLNDSGVTYVAYLFANNNGDGEFGPDSDQDIIKCGSFTGTSSGEVSVNLGFEPQFIIYKLENNTNSGDNDNWRMHDVMRGWNVSNRQLLNPNQNAAESSLSNTGGYEIKPTATGFIHEGHAGSSGSNYIYMAIRRGPLAAPEDATKVFHVNQQNNADTFSVGFPTDLAIVAKTAGSSSNSVVGSRLTGDNKFLVTSATDAEATSSSIFTFDLQNSFKQGFSTSAENVSWLWKRAPSYFDVVAYTGTGSARTISHNLGAVPEMMWVKRRSGTRSWFVYHSALGNTGRIKLDTTDAGATGYGDWNSTTPTSSVFSVGSGTNTNGNGETYIAYLFATVAGVSKVGSYTGNGSSQNIDCGFSNGARFVLIKKTDSSQDWVVFDSARGIVSGNDPWIGLNNTDAETTGYDAVDPYSAGFSVGPDVPGIVNANGSLFIFYAIA